MENYESSLLESSYIRTSNPCSTFLLHQSTTGIHKTTLNTLHYYTMKTNALLLSLFSVSALTASTNSSDQGVPSTEKAAAPVWAGPHSSALPGPTAFQTIYRAIDISAAQPSEEVTSVLQIRGDGDNYHCNNDGVKRWCHFKASMHIFDEEKHYNRCIQKCVRKHNGDNYGLPDEEEGEEGDEGDALLEKRDDFEDHPCNKLSKKVGCRTECM
jgi:hypothetical protein